VSSVGSFFFYINDARSHEPEEQNLFTLNKSFFVKGKAVPLQA